MPPTKVNGLDVPSQIMVDEITTVRKDNLRQPIGRLTPAELEALNRALRLWLELST